MGAAYVPPLPHGCGSWIIIDRASGRAVRELYQRANVARINAAKYMALTAFDYLASLNRKA